MVNGIKIKLENDCLKISFEDKVYILKKQIYKPVNKDSIPVNIKLAKFKHDNRYLLGLNKNKRRNNMSKPELKIRYHREIYPNLPSVEQHGNFIDLYCAKEYTLKAGEFTLIDLGVSVELPDGYWLQLVPRSSTFGKYGIIETNSFGVVDTSYCGDDDIVKMPAYALRDTIIPANERICQFRIVKDEPFDITEVEKLEGPNRGGFGSTGTN